MKALEPPPSHHRTARRMGGRHYTSWLSGLLWPRCPSSDADGVSALQPLAATVAAAHASGAPPVRTASTGAASEAARHRPAVGVAPVTDVELASRLSCFLWSSIPDDALLEAALDGKLHEPAVLRAQVDRMLADPRAESMVTNFAAQWLFLREVEGKEPDIFLFPDHDVTLRRALARNGAPRRSLSPCVCISPLPARAGARPPTRPV